MDITKCADIAATVGLTIVEEGVRAGATRTELVGAAIILLVAMADAAGIPEETILEGVRAGVRDLNRAMAERRN